MAQTVLGRAPSRPYAHTGISDICREAARLTARRYRIAHRRAGREDFAARLLRAFSVFISALSLAAIPFRALGGVLVYAAAGCVARVRHGSRDGSFTLVLPEAAAGKKHNHARINTALAFIAAGVLVFAVSIYRVGLEVILDGESIGYVSSQSVVEESLAAVSLQAGEILGRPFTIAPDISYRFSIVNKNKMYDNEGVERGLLGNIPDIDRLSVLTIDGLAVGAAWAPSDLDSALKTILAQYPADAQKSFYQDVKIQSQLAPISLLRSPDELILELTNTAHGGKPLLSVEVIELFSYQQSIPFVTEYVDDSTLWMGESKVLTHGVDGEEMVMAKLTSVDGFEPQTDITGSLVITEPVTEVIATGTRHRNATGKFIRPYYGQISSNYGMRTLNGVRGMHYGVDFRGPRGDPIVASDGGVVEFVGTKSGYGMVVIIDHQNGFKTVYGHCSKILVTKGQKVGQGERIANIGSTGRSTGNHVHFEIQDNGVAKNPMNYLGK